MAFSNTPRFTQKLRHEGFTLLEVMTSLAIGSILLTVAVPAMQDFIIRNRMSTEVNTFVASLYLARSEAVKRLRIAKVCPTTDYINCTGDTDWEPGWMVFSDDNNNDHIDAGTDVLVQQNPALPSRFKITGDPSRPEAQFQSNGQAGGSNNTFVFCDTGNVAYTRKVYLSNEGRVRVEKLSTTGCAVSSGGGSGGGGSGGGGGSKGGEG